MTGHFILKVENLTVIHRILYTWCNVKRVICNMSVAGAPNFDKDLTTTKIITGITIKKNKFHRLPSMLILPRRIIMVSKIGNLL